MYHKLRLIWINLRYCFIRMLEFRVNTLVWAIHSVLWGLLAYFTVSLIFGQVSSIAGWTRNEALLLSLTCSMFNSFLWWFIYPGILHFETVVRSGDFDFYLLRPVSPRYLISTSRFEFDNYPRVFVMALMISHLITTKALPVTAASITSFVVLLMLGSVIFYSLFFMIATLCIWLTKLEQLEEMFDTAVVSGRYPTHIFKGGLRVVFFYLIPIAFVGTFPVSALLGKAGPELLVTAFFLAAIFLLISHWFWTFSLRHYSSASS